MLSKTTDVTMMFLERSRILDWVTINERSYAWVECNHWRFEFLSNSCQFRVVLAFALTAAGAVEEALLLGCRCDGSTKKIVVGSGLWYTLSCSLDRTASFLHDSGRESFHARRKSLRPMAEDAVGAVAAR